MMTIRTLIQYPANLPKRKVKKTCSDILGLPPLPPGAYSKKNGTWNPLLREAQRRQRRARILRKREAECSLP